MSKGCPVPMGDGICGEPNSLEIISHFNRLFQDRLAQIEAQADGGCLMEKIKLQEEWIHDLTEQNTMLVRVVQQLESEAVDRVHQLEDKLEKSGRCLHQVMKKYRERNFAADLLSEPLQKIARFEDDVKNVTEFVRRIREEKRWSVDGLFFHHIRTADLLGTPDVCKLANEDDLEEEEEARAKEGVIKELTDKVNYLESFGDPQEITRELQCRRRECETLHQEVATQREQIVLIKKELDEMEEKCAQNDRQVSFKEDIIGELRGEVKQLKQQTRLRIDCVTESNLRLENENAALKEATSVVKTHLEQLDRQFQTFLRERHSLRQTNKRNVKEKEALQCQCQVLVEEIALKVKEIQALNLELADLRAKLRELSEEHRKALERVVRLNEENVSLTETVDLLRQRSDYTTGFTQEEVSKLNCTIEELRSNLEKTQFLHDQEEEAHRKELSLLHVTINSLQNQLKSAPKACKICKKRSKVGFLESTEVQADLEAKEASGTYDSKCPGAEDLREMQAEIDRKNREIDGLKSRVNDLEKALKNCEERAVNLQDAVSTYSSSVAILEKSEEAAQSEIQQQKITISNLQQALVEAKQEVDEIRKKSRDNDKKRQDLVAILECALEDMEEENTLISAQTEKIQREYQTLQDLNFALEIEHCDQLQDMDSLESQLKKYQYLFNVNEEQTKKLSKQKRCYEEIIAYFKQEMGLMADQLNNLQELLTMSNETAQLESTRIMTAFNEVQSLNERLSSELCCETKTKELYQSKIGDLQRLVEEKDRVVADIRTTLHESQKQNENLQKTVADLSGTVAELQLSLREYQESSCREFKLQLNEYSINLEEVKKNLEEKTAECLKLEMAYNQERRSLKTIQKRLQETETELEKLTTVEKEKPCQECQNLQNQLANLTRKEAVKDLEIKRYRKIVGDLKATMIELNSELNKNLAHKEGGGCKNPDCHTKKEDFRLQDVCLGCPCEVEFYQKMVDILKQSVSELKRKLTDTEVKNQQLEEEVKRKTLDLKQTKDELNRQLSKTEKTDGKIADLEREIHHLAQELQVKNLQLNDVKKSANEINGSKCVQLAYAQEEIANLKNEVANILNRQFLLKRENEDLRAETAQLHCTISCLHEQNQTLKNQLDQYLARIKNLNAEKEVLLKKNKDLLSELRLIQSDKQQRSVAKQLEELKNSKNEICTESRNVIKNVKAWVNEQKNINSNWIKREQELIETIRQLGQSKEMGKPGCKNICSSPYSLGSQGSASIYGESPPPSPDFALNNEWYSTTFRAESENESEDDYCINTLENLTQQMRQTNRSWRGGKCPVQDCRVTKERKS